MSLEIIHNRATTHENEQFRRVAESIEKVFDELNYQGLLIGNPFNEKYSRFRADAILFYNNGILLIDFKDYQGIIKLPPDENEFHSSKWYIETEKDRTQIEIKSGKFINPFIQLGHYRNVFKEIIEKNIYLNCKIDPSRVCTVNIFSGPIEIVNKVLKSVPYYKLIQESNLKEFLYDFESDNKFSTEIAEVIKKIFPAETYIKNVEHNQQDINTIDRVVKIDENVEEEIKSFLTQTEGGILVLESMNLKDRDSWLRFIQKEATNHDIPQIETWSHSTRISKRILSRANIQVEGVYSIIYGGTHDIENVQDIQNDAAETDDGLLEVIPIKSNDSIDKNALIIIHEAHLINRSLNQSELLRFGTGRLLEDIIKFLDPDSNRKIILIGDPYSLTYGKEEDSALHIETLSELYSKKKIKHYREKVDDNYSNNKEQLCVVLAKSIENKLFNNLDYNFDNETLKDISNPDIPNKLKLWFEKPFDQEPTNAVLFYSKKDCLTTNLWIKKNSLNNGEKLSTGDLLIANNNITIPDDRGFQIPRKIVNGMFFTVLEVNESISESISIRNIDNPIILVFTRLTVKCLSLNNTPTTDLWILDNYFQSEDDLSREEKIAFRIFINQKITTEKTKRTFQDSKQFRQLLEDKKYEELSEDEKTAIKQIVRNYNLTKEEKIKVETTKNARDLLSQYNKLYTKHIFAGLRETDPFINALFAKYGWAITVHKALGSTYNEIIIKGHRKENDGITNESYFRWLYSGVSLSEIVYINAPQKINPVMNCQFEDISNQRKTTEEKNLLIFENYTVEPPFIEKLLSIENKNVIGSICEISKKLEQEGYLLESTKKYSDYLTKAFYSTSPSDKQLILNIDNKGAKDNFAVGKIRVEKSESTNLEFVKQCIAACFTDSKNKNSSSDETTNFPADFRNEIYTVWLEKCKEIKIDLKIIQQHSNQDIFKANTGDDTISFRVWYGTSEQSHTKGFLSKIEILEKTSDKLVQTIKDVVYG